MSSDDLKWLGEIHKAHWEAIVERLRIELGGENIQDIEDAVSDVFMNLIEGFVNGTLERPDNAVVYIRRAARYRYFQIRKRIKRREEFCRIKGEVRPVQEWSAMDQVVHAEFTSRLREWVGRELPHRLRQVILLRLEGLTYREIAAVMGITFQGTRVYFARGVAKLRRTRKRPA